MRSGPSPGYSVIKLNSDEKQKNSLMRTIHLNPQERRSRLGIKTIPTPAGKHEKNRDGTQKILKAKKSTNRKLIQIHRPAHNIRDESTDNL